MAWFLFLMVRNALVAAPAPGDWFDDPAPFPTDGIRGPAPTDEVWVLAPPKWGVPLGLATAEPGEPLIDGAQGAHSLWFQWRATNAGAVWFSAVLQKGTNAPLLAVYSGDRLAGLQQVSNPIPPGDWQKGWASPPAVVGFQAVEGQTYQLRVDADFAIPLSTNQTVSVGLFLASTNDVFAGRMRLPFSGSIVAFPFRLTAATREPKEPLAPDARSVWFEFVVPESGAYQVTAGEGLAVAVHQGDALPGLRRRGWKVDGKDRYGRETGTVRDERFTAQAGERLVLSVSAASPLISSGTGKIWRVPHYDPVPAPSVRFGIERVGPPKLSIPELRPSLIVDGWPGRLYEVQTSADLRTWRHWQWFVPAATNSAVDLENGTPPDPFLRVVAPD